MAPFRTELDGFHLRSLGKPRLLFRSFLQNTLEIIAHNLASLSLLTYSDNKLFCIHVLYVV